MTEKNTIRNVRIAKNTNISLFYPLSVLSSLAHFKLHYYILNYINFEALTDD